MSISCRLRRRKKKDLWGHPTPRQRTLSSALLFRLLPAAAKWGNGVFGDTPHPSKGRCPLHSCFVCCLRRRMEKEFFGGPLLHPLDVRPRNLAKDAVLCTPVRVYTFLNVQVTLPKESLSPSLTGVALSGSRRLPLMRVEFVLFRSVTV